MNVKKIKFNQIIIILSAIFIGMIFWKFLNLLSFTDQSISFEGDSKQEKFHVDKPIIQKIIATENNFSQINVSIDKFAAEFGDKIVMEVLDESCQNILAESKLDMFSWYSPNYTKLKFKTIPDSKNKTYCLKFTYIPFGKEQDKKPYISSYSYEGASYINTGKSNEEQKNRSLELKPAYNEGSAGNNFSKLIDRMSQYKPNFLKGIILEIIFIAALLLVLIFIIVILLI
jgi:hypothetical protein